MVIYIVFSRFEINDDEGWNFLIKLKNNFKYDYINFPTPTHTKLIGVYDDFEKVKEVISEEFDKVVLPLCRIFYNHGIKTEHNDFLNSGKYKEYNNFHYALWNPDNITFFNYEIFVKRKIIRRKEKKHDNKKRRKN